MEIAALASSLAMQRLMMNAIAVQASRQISQSAIEAVSVPVSPSLDGRIDLLL